MLLRRISFFGATAFCAIACASCWDDPFSPRPISATPPSTVAAEGLVGNCPTGWEFEQATATWVCDGGVEWCDEDLYYGGMCDFEFGDTYFIMFACETAYGCDGAGDSSNPGCGDDRDQLIAQYAAHGVGFTPQCWDFMNGASYPYNMVYARYPFIDMRSPDALWAILRYPLTTPYPSVFGLDRWVAAYGGTMFPVNSVYRTPAHNAAVGGAQYSRHLFGDAVDADAGTQALWNALKAAADSAHADYIEPQSQSGLGHVHADWRGH
jgi:hypothetical protein